MFKIGAMEDAMCQMDQLFFTVKKKKKSPKHAELRCIYSIAYIQLKKKKKRKIHHQYSGEYSVVCSLGFMILLGAV